MTPFGHYLETVRRARDMQQTELANLLGIDPSYISALERGKKGPPSENILQKIKTLLSLSDIESKELDLAVAQSERVIRLPNNTSLAEYALISTLRRRIGSLSDAEVNAIACILQLREERANYGEKIMS